MEHIQRPRVKICCISSIDEARLAVRYGASALGLVSAMPSGPGVIGEDLIAAIARTIPPAVASILLTSRQDVPSIIEQQRRTGVNTLQLCDRLIEGTYEDLRAALPGIALIQVIHVTGEESLQEAKAIAPHVHALLLDSGNQSLAIKELGGTGRVHNWSVSMQIRAQVEVPIFLAGGLNAENVASAIALVGPYGLDICSGVRTDGALNEMKLKQFFANITRIASIERL
ncbi:N-(5'-phosphoribosyl)anthranilate isomerase [Ktedonobacteria bacterium brp13]|nr:N-(5'-phosphoribosyl)anthranilate isomerase [Ktedonobacteria bacterium brp13]